MSVKFYGWDSKKIDDVTFLQCPYCECCFKGISTEKDGTVECYKCNKKFHKNKLKTVILKKPVAICKNCNAKVSLTSENLDLVGGYSYICPTCNNFVAIKFKNYTLQPQTVMNLNWNKKIRDNAARIDDEVFFSVCSIDKDFLVLRMMQLMAKEEETGFLYVKEKDQKAALVFNENKYLGFVGWTEHEKPILRQIFVEKNERLKGHGTKIFKFWVENIANKLNDTFGVETPNHISQKILLNLGYAENKEGRIVGKKCFFVSSC